MKTLKLILLLLILIILGKVNVWSQYQIERNSINLGGGNDFTIGQAVIGEFNGAFTLTNGFQQANIDQASSSNDVDFSAEVNLFPNPTYDYFQLEIDGVEKINGRLVLTNIYGKICRQQTVSLQGFSTINISVEDLPNGVYLCTLKNAKNQNLTTLKVIKL